jgi:sarcosine oxidase subunit gamma
MSDYNPVFRSPIMMISSLTSPSTDLALSDLTGVPVMFIQGEADDLLKEHFAQIPAKPGDLAAVGDGLLARLTPLEFYLFGLSPRAKLPTAADLDHHFAKARRFAHATDYTHGKAVLRLWGAAAPDLLNKICGLDFYDTVFPNGRVAQTSAAKIKTLVARYDIDNTPTYFLHVNRPLGQYFWEVIWDAGQEFGATAVDG